MSTEPCLHCAIIKAIADFSAANGNKPLKAGETAGDVVFALAQILYAPDKLPGMGLIAMLCAAAVDAVTFIEVQRRGDSTRPTAPTARCLH